MYIFAICHSNFGLTRHILRQRGLNAKESPLCVFSKQLRGLSGKKCIYTKIKLIEHFFYGATRGFNSFITNKLAMDLPVWGFLSKLRSHCRAIFLTLFYCSSVFVHLAIFSVKVLQYLCATHCTGTNISLINKDINKLRILYFLHPGIVFWLLILNDLK